MGENNCELKNNFPELAFTLGHVLNNNKKILVVTQCLLTFLPPFEYTCVQVTIEEVCSYRVHVLLEGSTVSDDTEVCALLQKFSNVSYTFCQRLSGHTTMIIILMLFISVSESSHLIEASFHWVDSVNCVNYGLNSHLVHH